MTTLQSVSDHWLRSAAWRCSPPPGENRLRVVLAAVDKLVRKQDCIPSLGFVLDFAHCVFDRASAYDDTAPPPMPAELMSAYQDEVYFRIIDDRQLDALRGVLAGVNNEQQSAVLSFLLHAMLARLDWTPTEFRGVTTRGTQEKLAEFCKAPTQLSADAPVTGIINAHYTELLRRFRRSPQWLAAQDLNLIRAGAAELDAPTQLALRQIEECSQSLIAARLHLGQPNSGPELIQSDEPVPSHIHPRGGFTGITNRGDIQDALPSEFTFLESHGARPDLFDLKLARRELLCFQRDDAVHWTTPQQIVLSLDQSLVELRFAHRCLPFQSNIILLAWIRNLTQALLEENSAAGSQILMQRCAKIPLRASQRDAVPSPQAERRPMKSDERAAREWTSNGTDIELEFEWRILKFLARSLTCGERIVFAGPSESDQASYFDSMRCISFAEITATSDQPIREASENEFKIGITDSHLFVETTAAQHKTRGRLELKNDVTGWSRLQQVTLSWLTTPLGHFML